MADVCKNSNCNYNTAVSLSFRGLLDRFAWFDFVGSIKAGAAFPAEHVIDDHLSRFAQL
jgi:hypothetical protein